MCGSDLSFLLLKLLPFIHSFLAKTPHHNRFSFLHSIKLTANICKIFFRQFITATVPLHTYQKVMSSPSLPWEESRLKLHSSISKVRQLDFFGESKLKISPFFRTLIQRMPKKQKLLKKPGLHLLK